MESKNLCILLWPSFVFLMSFSIVVRLCYFLTVPVALKPDVSHYTNIRWNKMFQSALVGGIRDMNDIKVSITGLGWAKSITAIVHKIYAWRGKVLSFWRELMTRDKSAWDTSAASVWVTGLIYLQVCLLLTHTIHTHPLVIISILKEVVVISE